MAHTPEDGMVPHCAAQLMTNEDLFLPGVYERRSELAHQVLGVGLLCIVLVWGAFIIEVPVGFNLRQAYLLAGFLEALSGSFLLVWVFYLLEPSQPVALAKYAMKSLVQLQHVAISLSLLACGMTDVAISVYLQGHRAKQTGSTRGRENADLRDDTEARSVDSGDDIDDEEVGDGDEETSIQFLRRNRSSGHGSCNGRGSEYQSAWGAVRHALRFAGSSRVAWPSRVEAHTVWAMNLTFAGLVFLTHPQMSLEKDGEHVALGLSLIIGAHFLAIERREGWKPDSMQALVAGAFFGVAVTILCIFREFRPPAAASPHATHNSSPTGDDQKGISGAGIDGSRKRGSSSGSSSGSVNSTSSSISSTATSHPSRTSNDAQATSGESVDRVHRSSINIRTSSSSTNSRPHARRAQGHIADDDGFHNTKDDDDDWDVVDERGKAHVESKHGSHASADHPYKQSKSHAGSHVVVLHLGNNLPNQPSATTTTTNSEPPRSSTAVAGSILSGNVLSSDHERSNFVCLEDYVEEHTSSVHLCRRTDGSRGWVCPHGWEQIQKPPRCLPSKSKGSSTHRTTSLSASTQDDKVHETANSSGGGSGSSSKASTSKSHGGGSKGGRSKGGRSNTVHHPPSSRTHSSDNAHTERALAVAATGVHGGLHSRALDGQRRAQGRAISDDALANEFVDTVDDDDDDHGAMYISNLGKEEEGRGVNGRNSDLDYHGLDDTASAINEIPTSNELKFNHEQNKYADSSTIVNKKGGTGEDKNKVKTKQQQGDQAPPFVCASGYAEEASAFAGRVCRKADGSKNWRCPIGWLQTKELPHCVWHPPTTTDGVSTSSILGSKEIRPDRSSSDSSNDSISSSTSGISRGSKSDSSSDSSGGSASGSSSSSGNNDKSMSTNHGKTRQGEFATGSTSGSWENSGVHGEKGAFDKAGTPPPPFGSHPIDEHGKSAALSMPISISSPKSSSASSSSSVGVHRTVVADACQSGLQLAVVAGILAILTVLAAAGALVCGFRCHYRCKHHRNRVESLGGPISSTIGGADASRLQTLDDEEWQAAAVQIERNINGNHAPNASGTPAAVAAAAATTLMGTGGKHSHLMHPGRYELVSSK